MNQSLLNTTSVVEKKKLNLLFKLMLNQPNIIQMFCFRKYLSKTGESDNLDNQYLPSGHASDNSDNQYLPNLQKVQQQKQKVLKH